MIAVAAALAVPVMGSAASGGDSNRGDVWLDNVGQPAGPGHEMDPHLACADINLWGANLADASGIFTIDGWPPSGRQEQVYPASGSAADRSIGHHGTYSVSCQARAASSMGGHPAWSSRRSA